MIATAPVHDAASDPAPSGQRTAILVIVVLSLVNLLLALTVAAIQLMGPRPQPGFRKTFLSGDAGPSAVRPLQLTRESLDWLPFGVTETVLAPTTYLWSIRAAWALMVVVQIVAILFALRYRNHGIRWWAVGAAFATAAYLLYPPVCNDVFSYSSFAWVANTGENPYFVRPMDLEGDPFARYNYWVKITTPYGPLWTSISRVFVWLGGYDPFLTAMLFKIFVGLCALLLGWLTYRLAWRLERTRPWAVAAYVAVAWSPVLMTEAAGSAHLDVVAILIALSGLLIALDEGLGRLRTGIAVVALAALVKPTLAPLLILLSIMRLARTSDRRVAVRGILGDAAVSIALALAAFAPYLSLGVLTGLWGQQERLLGSPNHANPLWVWIVPSLGTPLGLNDLLSYLQAVFAYIAWLSALFFAIRWFVRSFRALKSGGLSGEVFAADRIQIVAWALFLGSIGYLPLNAHAWYAIPAYTPIALTWLMRERDRRGWYLALVAWTGCYFILYHTLAQ